MLVYFEYRSHWFYFFGGLAFVVGSVLDILDGALARAGGKQTPFGGFLDSTLDRVGEGLMLGAIALVFMRDGKELALALAVAAIGGSSSCHARAKAEGLGIKGRRRHRLAGRARRRDRSRPRARAVGRAAVGDRRSSRSQPGSRCCSESCTFAASSPAPSSDLVYSASRLAASTSRTERTSVLVRMPGSLKRALVREVARRESNLNDVAVALLAQRFGVTFAPSGRRRKVIPGAAGAVVLRMPPELRRELKTSARRRNLNVNDLVLLTLSEALAVPFASNRKDTPMASTNGSPNGKARGKDKVRVAIVGVGNCANSLLQGVHYYKDAPDDEFVPGLMHVNLGGYHVSDIEFTAAFDVTAEKVGKDLADAIWAHPNDTIKFADVPKTGITVNRGMTHDGIGKYLSQVVTKAPGETDDIVGILQETKTDVVVSYLPVGSEAAAKWYAEQCLEAGVALVNCMPVFIARENYWQKRFEEKGLPIIGDDIKSQVGATITHRVLTSLFRERGVKLDKTMQLNVGGNSDFLNMLERDRLESKKISKTNAVTSMLDYDLGERNVHVGPRTTCRG